MLSLRNFNLDSICCGSKLQVDRQSHVQRLGQRHERTGDSQLGRYLCAAQLAFRGRAKQERRRWVVTLLTAVGGTEMPSKMLAPSILCPPHTGFAMLQSVHCPLEGSNSQL